MLDRVVNVPLMTHPLNWLIVWTVLLLVAFGAALIHLRIPNTFPEVS